MLDGWSRKQGKLFREYKNVNDGLTISETRSELKETQAIWLKLYEILSRSGLRLTEYSRIDNVEFKNEKDKYYLIITIFSKRHIVIDFKDIRCLSEQEIVYYFSNKTLLDLIGESNFSFEEISDDIAREFVDTYLTYQDVYNRGTCLSYPISKGKYKSYFSMDFVTLGYGLSFVGPNEVNYMFFQGDKLDGMSGDCDRKLACEIGEQVKSIKIPREIVDKYKVTEADYKLRYTKGV